MKKIQILGTGCPKCVALTANAEAAAQQAGVAYSIEKVTDVKEIVKAGVMLTPALSIDGKLVSMGKILSPDEIAVKLKG
jgi:small redox-active disulfide protein 2